MRPRRLTFTLVATLLAGAAQAAECPTAATAEKGFMLLQVDTQSEFRKHYGPIVKITNRYGSPAGQTVFSYRGLIDLSRMGAGSQQALYALSDLKNLFPLKKGARQSRSSL